MDNGPREVNALIGALTELRDVTAEELGAGLEGDEHIPQRRKAKFRAGRVVQAQRLVAVMTGLGIPVPAPVTEMARSRYTRGGASSSTSMSAVPITPPPSIDKGKGTIKGTGINRPSTPDKRKGKIKGTGIRRRQKKDTIEATRTDETIIGKGTFKNIPVKGTPSRAWMTYKPNRP